MRIPNVETKPKLLKQLCRETFGHDISKLVGGRHMKHPKVTERHLANEINVNLNMFGAVVLNRV